MTETELFETMGQLRQLDVQIAALTNTRSLLRGVIADHMGRPATKASFDWEDRRVTWHPPSETKTLDRTRLVAAGVTPEQLEKGTVKGTKKGYLDVRKIGERDPAEE